VTSKVQTVTATPANKTFTVGYSYSNGRQSGITYPSGRAITYGFNSAGQVTSITVDGTTSVLSGGEYFPFGSVKKWTWGNAQVYERAFDQDGQISTLTLGPSTGTYSDLSQVFGYDNLNRLLSANLAAGQTQSFTYDANSNRLSATINAATTSYTYPSTSHKLSSLSGATTRSFTYDNAGNVTASASVTYVYDGRGRMKSAGAATYLVNGLGQRVRKNTGSDTFFVYDEAGHLIGEYDASGTPIQETVWFGDTPVAIIKPASPSGFTLYYIWTDHLGTPRLITDTANQSRWEWAHNDPFGNNAPNENPSNVGVFGYNLRFPGQYYDNETGKYYNYFRDYDASIGRYLQSDPAGLRADLNTFGYVGGAPLDHVDPWGLCRLASAYWTTNPRLTNFDVQYEGVTSIHTPRISSLLTVYMFELVMRGSAVLHARGECQWECECGAMQLTVTSVYQPINKQFKSPIGLNIFTSAFGGKGYAALLGLAAAHAAEGAVNAVPFIRYALGVKDAIEKRGPAALCYASGTPR
jgi:RHS repeat-associated protein